MRLRGSTRTAAFAVAVAAFVGSMTGVAWAPKNLSTHVIDAACEVKPGGPGTFVGSVSLTGLTMDKGQLLGVATVSGTCTLASGAKVLTSPRDTVLVPVSVEELSCHELDLVLGNITIGRLGMTVQTSAMHLFLSPGSRADEARFCAAERLAATRPLAEVLTPVSQLLFR